MTQRIDKACPFAPRHQPEGLRGRCVECGAEIPEPWYMRARPEPANWVGQIASRRGVTMPPHVAREIADVLLGYADHAIEIRDTVVRDAWNRPGIRGDIRRRMRARLFDEVVTQGCIPAGGPAEALRFFRWPSLDLAEGGTGEVPPTLAGQVDWQVVEVILAIPVRALPVDRAAAVQAGVL